MIITQDFDTNESLYSDMCAELEATERRAKEHLLSFADSADVQAVLQLQLLVVDGAWGDLANYAEYGQFQPGDVEALRLRLNQLRLLSPIVTRAVIGHLESLKQRAAQASN